MTQYMNPLRKSSDAAAKTIQDLRSTLGVKLTKVILGVDGPTLRKWADGTEIPNDHQQRVIYTTGYVTSVLAAHLTPREVKLWLVSPSDYLYGIPALELHARPEDVQNAALNRITRGEHYELLNEKLGE